MKRSMYLNFMLICLVAIATCEDSSSIKRPRLQFRKDGTFQIMQITDAHLDDDLRDTIMTQYTLKSIFAYEHPDFVAYTGDMVTGYHWDKTPGWFKRQWVKFTKCVNEHKIPYACALGNHDVEADLSREEIIRLDQTNPLSLTELGPEGPHNSHNSTKVVLNLWFFDSGNRGCMGDPTLGFGCIEPDIVEWYRQHNDELEKIQGKIPGLAFFHIPPQEFMEGWEHYNTTGHKMQATSCSGVNTGIVDAFLEKGNIKGLFVGHDHPNDFSVDYKGLYMAYGRKTGHGGYGIPNWIRKGTRMLIVNEDPFSFDTYIAREDGVREHLVNMHWTNGTQNVCNSD